MDCLKHRRPRHVLIHRPSLSSGGSIALRSVAETDAYSISPSDNRAWCLAGCSSGGAGWDPGGGAKERRNGPPGAPSFPPANRASSVAGQSPFHHEQNIEREDCQAVERKEDK